MNAILVKFSKVTVSTILKIFEKQFKRAFCPRNEIANQKKKHLKIECCQVIGLIYRWKIGVFWKSIKETPNIEFHFCYSKTPLHVTFLHIFSTFFFKISPTSHTYANPPTFSCRISPLIICFSSYYCETFLIP